MMIRRLKIAAGILMGIAVAAMTLWWMRAQDMFILNRVKITGNRVLTSEEILELAYLDFSQELFDVDPEKVKERILYSELIDDVHIRKIYPSGMIIDVVEKEIIASCAGSRLHLIDANGRVTLSDNFEALYDSPVITGAAIKIDSLNRKMLSENLATAAGVLKAIKNINFQLYHDISEVHCHSTAGIVLYLRKNAVTIVLGNDNLAQKILDLSIFYNERRDQGDTGKKYKLLDLRFDGQIIIKNQTG